MLDDSSKMRRWWQPWTLVIFAAALFFIAQIVAELIVVVYPHLRGWPQSRGEDWLTNAVTAQFWYVLFAEALTVLGVWWLLRGRKFSLRDIGWRPGKWSDVGYAVAGYFVYFVIFLVTITLATHFLGINTDQKQQLGFDNPQGSLNLVLTFFSLVVLPPIAEETVFRGLVFTGLRVRMRWLWAALITTALFAAAHLEFGSGAPLLWSAAIDTFCLSLVLCWLREKTGGLWAGAYVHAGKNFVAFWALYLVPLVQLHMVHL